MFLNKGLKSSLKRKLSAVFLFFIASLICPSFYACAQELIETYISLEYAGIKEPDCEDSIPQAPAAVSDLKIAIADMPVVIINREVSIPLKVTNIGEAASVATEARLLVNGRVVEGKSVKPLNQGVSEILSFKWTPTEKEDCELVFDVDADNRIEECQEDNNFIYERVKVLAPEYDWFIKEDSLIINPFEPEVGEQVMIYFTIQNDGRTQERIAYDVFIDDERIARHAAVLKPDTTYTVGIAPEEKIIWKVTKGEHVIKVVLDPQKEFFNPVQIGVIQELVIACGVSASTEEFSDYSGNIE